MVVCVVIFYFILLTKKCSLTYISVSVFAVRKRQIVQYSKQGSLNVYRKTGTKMFTIRERLWESCRFCRISEKRPTKKYECEERYAAAEIKERSPRKQAVWEKIAPACFTVKGRTARLRRP